MIELNFDRSKTLQELDGQDWGEPNYPSHLVTTCYALRHKPLAEFNDEDLRIMIRQGLSLPYLVPIALEWLHKDIWAGGNVYDGALLNALSSVDTSFWNEHPDYTGSVEAMLELAIKLPYSAFDSLSRVAVDKLCALSSEVFIDDISYEQLVALQRLEAAKSAYHDWQQMLKATEG